MFRRKSLLPASGYDVTSSNNNRHLEQPARGHRGLKPMAGTMPPQKPNLTAATHMIKEMFPTSMSPHTQVTSTVDSASSNNNHRRKPIAYYYCVSFGLIQFIVFDCKNSVPYRNVRSLRP
jgi:hypothetical protein